MYFQKFKFQLYVVFRSAAGLKTIFGVYENILVKFVKSRRTLNTSSSSSFFLLQLSSLYCLYYFTPFFLLFLLFSDLTFLANISRDWYFNMSGMAYMSSPVDFSDSYSLQAYTAISPCRFYPFISDDLLVSFSASHCSTVFTLVCDFLLATVLCTDKIGGLTAGNSNKNLLSEQKYRFFSF